MHRHWLPATVRLHWNWKRTKMHLKFTRYILHVLLFLIFQFLLSLDSISARARCRAYHTRAYSSDPQNLHTIQCVVCQGAAHRHHKCIDVQVSARIDFERNGRKLNECEITVCKANNAFEMQTQWTFLVLQPHKYRRKRITSIFMWVCCVQRESNDV